jgi:hypothetical protein
MRASIFICLIHLAVASTTLTAKSTTVSAITKPSSSSACDGAEVAERSEDDARSSLQDLKKTNPFVAASPLSVAAVCSDGIALVSLHYGMDDDHETTVDDEVDGIDKVTNISSSRDILVEGTTQLQRQSNQHSWSRSFRDLPISSRGPLRIEQVHAHQGNGMATQQISTVQPLPPPMAILTAGWRTDGMALASAARELMAEERMLYCLPHLAIMSEGPSSDDVPSPLGGGLSNNLLADDVNRGSKSTAARLSMTSQPYYGRRIAEGLSYYMAKCEFSESTRSLSTVGLFICGANESLNGEGSIFLIDATGAYRVRAHAIGAGASLLNRRMGFVDFRKMPCREGLMALLRLIADESGLVESVSSSSSEAELTMEEHNKATDVTENSSYEIAKTMSVAKQDETTNALTTHSRSRLWNLPQNVATELAMIRDGEGKMRRIRLATLLDSH